jgi:aminoglycoside/choline kinase family phosphotransferase
MNEEMFLWESEYFATHCVTEFFGLERMLDTAWHRQQAAIALSCASYEQVIIHRDFQSENILIHNGHIRFVDYQGARSGPAGYDVASLLQDPYVRVINPQMHERLLHYFRTSCHPLSLEEYWQCAMQRLMQALGAYANLSLHKGKERYRAFIPVALRRLHHICEQSPRYTQLGNIVGECLNKFANS